MQLLPRVRDGLTAGGRTLPGARTHVSRSLALRIRCAVTLLILVLTLACTEQLSYPAAPEDSWYRDAGIEQHEFFPLPLFLFTPVAEELVAEATTAMGDGPLLQLSTSEARRYATNPLRTMRELRPFLIHGLYRNARVFNVAIADRALWVDSADDPYDASPVRRQPLVIYIDEVPPDVYVTVGWAARRKNEAARRSAAD